MSVIYDDYEVQVYKYSDGYNGYYIRIKDDGLTYEMSFCHGGNDDCDYWLTYYVCLSIYRKRKDVVENFDNHKLTGNNSFKSFIFAKNAFKSLYDFCAPGRRIIIEAIDDRRAKVYEKFLSDYGFEKKYIHKKGLSKFIFVKDNR